MASAREVKGRIKSVKNIAQITRALEAVSASRVRRAQERVTASRNYAEKAWEILLNVNAASKGQAPHPMLTEREQVNNILVVLVTSDRGLAGSFNTNVIRVADRFETRVGKPVKYITVGRKGRDSLIRQGKNVIAEFSDLPATPSVADIAPIAKICMEEFLSGDVDEVLIAYTDFINMLTQSPVVLGWLPLTPNSVANQVASEYVKDVPEVSAGATDYEYEPSPAAVIDEIVPRFTELQLYQALLESIASEHAARMTAMRNATDNASTLVDDLTLEYNKARQSAITNEILDIVGGASALEDTLKAKAKAKAKNAAASAPIKIKSSANGSSAKPAKAAVATDTPDDLTKVEGIGPKMSRALIDAGISTFAQLANASEDQLTQAVQDAGMRLAPSLGTWAEQASYAAKGDWDGLDKLQDQLQGGRRVD
ncbi:MAG: ATP synthase F1 subunit gamma [Phototrophicaceae bacterium]